MTSSNFSQTDFIRKHLVLLISFLLCLIIFGLYWQTLHHQFVFDDKWYVLENKTVSQGLTFEGLRWAFMLTEKKASYFHPLSWLSHMLDVELFGLKPAGHHLTNIILHCLNTLLLFQIFIRLTKNIIASTIVALLFAIHPINIETVAWVAERKNLLSVFFGLCTILAYIRYAAVSNASRYLVVLLLFLCSLLAKPTLVILPLILLLLDFWPLERLQLNRASAKRNWKLILEKIPMLALSIASVLVATASLRMYGTLAPVSKVPMQLRIANAFVSGVKYIWKIIAPFGQSVFYPFPTAVPVAYWASSLLFLGTCTLLCLKTIKKEPYLFFGWLWFLIALLPVSGIMQGGLWPALADRFAYFPAIGLFVIVAWSAEKLFHSDGKPLKIGLSFFGVAAFLSLLAITNAQIKTWKTPLSLFQQAIRYAPDNYVMNLDYANALFDNGQVENSIDYYRKAITLNANSFKAHRNLAIAFTKQHNYSEAINQYRISLQLLPGTDESPSLIHFELGGAYEKVNDLANAANQYSLAIQLDPNFIEAYNTLGIVLAEQGKTKEAVALFQKALQLKPDDPFIRRNLDYAMKLQRKKPTQ